MDWLKRGIKGIGIGIYFICLGAQLFLAFFAIGLSVIGLKGPLAGLIGLELLIFPYITIRLFEEYTK
mgnify:CR=1 FL=1